MTQQEFDNIENIWHTNFKQQLKGFMKQSNPATIEYQAAQYILDNMTKVIAHDKMEFFVSEIVN